MDQLIREIAPYAVPYISITGLAGQSYTYRKRFGEKQFPVVAHTMHLKKGGVGAMMYLAVAAGADLLALKDGQRLYVGSQSGVDRMFRGDGLKGRNFHHAQMREGNGGHGLERYLAGGGAVDVYAIASEKLIKLTATSVRMRNLGPMARGEVTLPRGRDYAGYWFEQLVLREEHRQWAWNTHGVQAEARAVFEAYGI